MTRNLADDPSNPNKTIPIGNDRAVMIDSETNPNQLKDVLFSNLVDNYLSTLLATISTTQTLTNKRVTKRVTSEVSSATPTINTNNTDIHRITALAVAITSMSTNLSGTPTHGQMLLIEFTDNGTDRAITWGASFSSTTQTLPTTTRANKMLRVLLLWDSADSTWDCVSIVEEV